MCYSERLVLQKVCILHIYFGTHFGTLKVSGVTTGGVKGQIAPLDSKKKCQKLGKGGRKPGKRGKQSGKRGKSGRFFLFALLTDRASYATA